MADYQSEGSSYTYDEWSVEDILDKRKDSARAQSNWRTNCQSDFDYRDGDQWDQHDKAILEEQGRPIVTFNRIGPIINAVKGQELNNRQVVKYIPRTTDDSGINETLNYAAQYVRDHCDAEDEESDAYEDACTCGMGWTETHVKYDEDPNGKIIIERIPPLQMRWDPYAKKRNLEDRTWCSREQWMDKRDVKKRWPDADLALTTEPMAQVDTVEHDATESWKYENDQYNKFYDMGRNRLLILHIQYRETENYYRVGDPDTGRVIELSVDRFNKIKDQLDERNITYVKQKRWKYKYKFLAGKEELEAGDSPVNDWSFNCITAFREEKTNYWYGLIKAMKEPQNWANKFFCQIMHIFNTNPKGGLIYEESAIDDSLRIEEIWADSSGVVKVNDGALTSGAVRERTMSNYPASLDKMLNFAITSIRDVSGMNVELLGLADREQSGVLEQERKKAALVILAPLQSAFRHYRKQQGRVLLRFIKDYMPVNTMIRIGDEAHAQFVPLTKDWEVLNYDVIVDTAPSSPNLKQEVWQNMTYMLPQLMQAGVPVPPALLDFSPLPSSVVMEWKKYIEERSGGDPRMLQQQNQQLQQAVGQLQQENQQLKQKQELQIAQMQTKERIAQGNNQTELQVQQLDNQAQMMKVMTEMTSDDRDRLIKLLELSANQMNEAEDRVVKLTEIDQKARQAVAPTA